MSLDKQSNVAKAQSAWGVDAPRYIMILAEACDQASQRSVCQKIGVSSAYVSKLINRAYEASYAEAEKLILSVFSADTVICPIIGEAISLKTCLRSRRFDGPALNLLHRKWRAHCPICTNNIDGVRK